MFVIKIAIAFPFDNENNKNIFHKILSVIIISPVRTGILPILFGILYLNTFNVYFKSIFNY